MGMQKGGDNIEYIWGIYWGRVSKLFVSKYYTDVGITNISVVMCW